MKSLAAIVLGAVVIASTPVGAATMTFDNLPHITPAVLGPSTHVEDGITAASDGDFASFARVEAAHLVDSGSTLTSQLIFTMASRFDALSFDLLPFSRGTAYDNDPNGLTPGDPYANVFVQGSRNGFVVAQDAFFAGTTSSTYLFGAAFSNLDSLLIASVLPDFTAIGGTCIDLPCGHFDIDNVTLTALVAPVPLPAALPLMAGAITLLGLLGWRRRRRMA